MRSKSSSTPKPFRTTRKSPLINCALAAWKSSDGKWLTINIRKLLQKVDAWNVSRKTSSRVIVMHAIHALNCIKYVLNACSPLKNSARIHMKKRKKKIKLNMKWRNIWRNLEREPEEHLIEKYRKIWWDGMRRRSASWRLRVVWN